MLEKANVARNYEAMKAQENKRAILEYGFSNTGELPTYTHVKVEGIPNWKKALQFFRP